MQQGLQKLVKRLIFSLILLSAASQAWAVNSGENKPNSPTAADSAFIQQYSKLLGVPLDIYCDRLLIETVAGWLGTPYRHAGYSKAGIDCSGFVSKIYKEVFDVNLTHSSSAMIYQMHTIVKKSELQQGDILFFRIRGKRISHVGIYLGEHKFVHASPQRGIVVDDLRTPYYQRTYYSAGRPKIN